MATVTRGKIIKRTWKWQGHKRVAYLFDVTVDGARVRKQYASKQEAQDELDAFKAKVKQPEPEPTVPTLILSEAFDRYFREKVKRTLDEDRRIAKHLLAEFGEQTALPAITAAKVSEFKGKLRAAEKSKRGGKLPGGKLSAASVNRPLALLRGLLKLACEEREMLPTVPKIKLEKEPQGRLRWLKPEEASRLLMKCRAARNANLADLVEFALYTGVRQGEALGLTWDRVDLSRGVIRLEVTKSGRRREVPLNGPADAVLARRQSASSDGLVFGSKRWDAFRTSWEKAVDATQLDDFRFHDLRHTFASWAIQRGATLPELQDLLGHSSHAMVKRYAHLAPENLRTAVARLDDVLAAPTQEGTMPAHGTTTAHEMETVTAAQK